MAPAHAAVFVDLDRTLLRGASGPVLRDALVAAGAIPRAPRAPGERQLYALYEHFGETVPTMLLARSTARYMGGRSVEAARAAGRAAVEGLVALVQPYAPQVLAEHRAAGRRLVLATTSPEDLVRPLADALGFDAVVATRHQAVGGRYTGRIDGSFVWGLGKRSAVTRWARAHDVDLARSHAYSDSIFDVPLLAAVGHPHAVHPDPRLAALALARRWPIEQWDRAPGMPALWGRAPYRVLRPFVRPESFPYARFDISGVEHIPSAGPVLLAANHRSYFDVAALALVAARLHRPVRFLAKQELFQWPMVGWIGRAMGGIPVDRDDRTRHSAAVGPGTDDRTRHSAAVGPGTDDRTRHSAAEAGAPERSAAWVGVPGLASDGARPGSPMRQAIAALRAGEVVVVLPQGTIPRGEAFFDPKLVGKTGVARLAAETGAPVVPIGLWGTEQVWPRAALWPNVLGILRPPRVTVRVGEPVVLGYADPEADTEVLMERIVALLPEEARQARVPTGDELRRTMPR